MRLLGIFGSGDARGSQGPVTVSRNRFGLYLRARVAPVNPNSARQQVVRNQFSSNANAWNGTLTQVQRDAWNAFAAVIQRTSSLGATIFWTGFNTYLSSNGAVLQAGGPRVDPGPTMLTLPGSDPAFAAPISEATQLIDVTFDNTLAWANEDDAFLLIAMSKPLPGGREFIGGPFRVAGAIAGDGITPPTSPATLAVPFAVAAGQKVDVQARVIRADGRVSEPFQVSILVAA